jgi:RNA polymerase sigma-70 factor (ECF subfamily)
MHEPDTTDEALMRRFRDVFDQAAFDTLLSRHYPRALQVARRLLGDHAAAEDAVQESFIRVVRSRREYDPARSFAGWFYTILRHICTDQTRRRARRARQVEELAQELPAVAYGSPVQSSTAVAELLLPLPPEDREILILRMVEGLSFHEIATRQGCSVEAAKKRAQRALRVLRERMDPLM